MKCLACARREDNDQRNGSKHRTILVLGFGIGDSIPNLWRQRTIGRKTYKDNLSTPLPDVLDRRGSAQRTIDQWACIRPQSDCY